MSLLSYTELVELVEQGVIDAPIENLNAASIDVTFDKYILVRRVRRMTTGQAVWEEISLEDGCKYFLKPGEFMLASTREYLTMPLDVSAEYKLKSSMAREGINHLMAGWVDAGFHGKLTLEFVNHDLEAHEIWYGKKAGQLIFQRHEPVPVEHSYLAKGRYNGQQAVTASKGIR